MSTLLNVTDVLTQQLRYHQIYRYAYNILAYFRDCLTYMRQVTMHTSAYLDAVMTNILSPDIHPVEELRTMLRHIEAQLLLIMHFY